MVLTEKVRYTPLFRIVPPDAKGNVKLGHVHCIMVSFPVDCALMSVTYAIITLRVGWMHEPCQLVGRGVYSKRSGVITP